MVRAAQAFNALWHNLLRYGGMLGSSMPSMRVSPELASLGPKCDASGIAIHGAGSVGEVGFNAAEIMIKQAKDNPEKAEERWAFLLSEEWMVE